MNRRTLGLLCLAAGGLSLVWARSLLRVGQTTRLGTVVATAQQVQTTGTRWDVGARPVDLIGDGGRNLFVKSTHSVIQIDAATGAVLHRTEMGSSSLHGLAITPDRRYLLATDAHGALRIFDVAGGLTPAGTVTFKPALGGDAYPCGVAVTQDGKTAYVCLSRANLLAKVDLPARKVVDTIPVSPAPYDVAISGKVAVVTCWGRKPSAAGLSAPSGGTKVEVDGRGIATGGSVDFVDLSSKAVTSRPTFGQPSQIVLATGGKAYVPCANGDEVSCWQVSTRQLTKSTRLVADRLTGIGIAPNAAALSADETLYLACGGMNAVAVLNLGTAFDRPTVNPQWVPADWYPIGIVAGRRDLYVVNAKGIGSRAKPVAEARKTVDDFTGTLNHMPLPLRNLSALSSQALSQATALMDRNRIPPWSPLFRAPGHPSPIKHVFYVIKENKTYDQVFGDVPTGDGDPNLTMYGRAVTPNMHALAQQFGLLDNFYCNGVLSADGHAWAVEGNATSFLERSFGGWTRSYPFGDDPISPNLSGFIWNDAVSHGVSFRNYGEFDYAVTKQNFTQNLNDLKNGKATSFGQNIGVASLVPLSQRDFPGWNMEIPDQVRAVRFIADFRAREAKRTVPTFNIVYLPEDHTGASVSAPTCVADNDRGLGLVVEAISHSKVWASSAIFVVEDDPASGFDHVDGHRSPGLVISPYSRHGAVVKEFYNQCSVLHTMEIILGLPPMNRMDASAPVMTTCFAPKPDLTPFDARPMGAKVALASPLEKAAHFDVSKPDQMDDDKANRLIWKLMRPGRAYPAEMAGAHGRGLAARGLRLDAVSRVAD